ncbi:MAG: hypothetical protein JNL79_26785 [Myxococcales bacterium]|nr:hypothetical protein [Myxococcales bacterium]
MLARLEAAALLSSFVVHELNNALTEASGNLELLSDDIGALAAGGPRGEAGREGTPDPGELLLSIRGVEHGLVGIRGVIAVVRGLYRVEPQAPGEDPRLVAELALALAKPDLEGVTIVRRYQRATVYASPREAVEQTLRSIARLIDEGVTSIEVTTSERGVAVERGG